MPVRWVRVMVSGIIGLAVWELFARFVVRSPLFLPTPDASFAAAAEIIRSGELFSNLLVRLTYFAVGSAIGFVAGVLPGILLGASREFADYVRPWVSAPL